MDRQQREAVQTMVRRMKSYQKDKIRLYERVLGEIRDMAQGGDGGPYRMGYTWTTVRKAYFAKWTDAQFVGVLDGLGETLQT